MAARLAAATLMGALATAAAVAADPYPARPVRVVIPTSPGGLLDITTRIVGTKVTEMSGKPVVIDNRPGASNNIGTELVARAPADGYTLLAVTLPFVVNPSMFKSVPYDPQRDFAPVSQLIAAPYVLVTNPSLPVKSVKELVALAKARPGALNYASGGSGTNLHVAAELFALTARVKMTHVPYKGGGPALASVLSGETALSFPSLAAVLPHVNGNRLRALGVTTLKANALLPDVPPIAATLPGYEFSSWIGLLAPAGTPQEVVAAINGYWVKALQAQDVAARFAADGSEVIANSPQEFSQVIRTQVARWAKVIQAAGLRAQ